VKGNAEVRNARKRESACAAAATSSRGSVCAWRGPHKGSRPQHLDRSLETPAAAAEQIEH